MKKVIITTALVISSLSNNVFAVSEEKLRERDIILEGIETCVAHQIVNGNVNYKATCDNIFSDVNLQNKQKILDMCYKSCKDPGYYVVKVRDNILKFRY